MKRLYDSLMRNYPIQTLLFWKTKEAIKARRFMDVIAEDVELSSFYDQAKSEDGVEKVFVLDGQQRLQTLFCLFSGALRDEKTGATLHAFVNLKDGEEVDDEGVKFHLEFRSEAPEPHWYKLKDLLTKDVGKNAWEIADTIDFPDKSKHQQPITKNLAQLITLLREDKHFWIEELDGVANPWSYTQILDIFVRVNSGGTKLDSADLLFAKLKESWADIEQEIERVVEFLNGERLEFDKKLVLQCLLLALGKGTDLKPQRFAETAGDELIELIKTNWSRSYETFEQLSDFIKRDIKVFSDKVVRSYGSFVPVFDYLYHHPKPDEGNRLLMRSYYYKAQLFNWFRVSTDTILSGLHGIVSQSTATTFPLIDIKAYFSAKGYDVELTELMINNNRARAIVLNLAYIDAFGTSPFDIKFKENMPETDHIYPKSLLAKDFKLPSTDIDHIGNFRFVGGSDNLRKRAEKPDSYFAREKARKADIQKHLLLADYLDPAKLKWDLKTYFDFRDRRAKSVFEIAKNIVDAELVVSV